MARIVKESAGCAPRLDGETGEYEWLEGGETVDVDDVTANVLLRIEGFSEVLDPREVKKAEKNVADPVEVEPPAYTGPAPAPGATPVAETAPDAPK